RLRAAGCILYEEGDRVTTIASPDGSFRLDVYPQPDDLGPRESICVVVTEGHEVLVDIPDASLTGIVAFPGSGVVEIPFAYAGRPHRIRINVPAHTFCFHPTEPEEPLEHLMPRLSALAGVPRTTRSRRAILGS